MLREDLSGIYLAIISHARPQNVPMMTNIVGDATWYVSAGEHDTYIKAGAKYVVESGPLCRSRNAALDDAFKAKRPCVELSDDLTKVQLAVRNPKADKIVAQDTTFKEAVSRVAKGMREVGAKLGGVAPTSNPFYANVDRAVHTSAFIVGDMIMVNPCMLRFDETMTLKEDYMYTLDHLMAFGCVARRDDVLLTFLHRKNAGGAVEVRTPDLEQFNIALLKAKYPQFIKDNPRRPNEILLNLPKRKAQR